VSVYSSSPAKNEIPLRFAHSRSTFESACQVFLDLPLIYPRRISHGVCGGSFKNIFDSANFNDRPFVPLAYLTKKVMHLFVLWLSINLLSPAFPHSAQDISPAKTRGLITQSASRSHAPRQAPWWFSR
jgi:hypothetical protein